MIIWSDEAITYLQYSKQWKIWYLWNFEICYVSNRLKDLLYQRKSIWLSHTSDFFSCSDSTFFHFSIHSLCREMRHLSVDQGGMSFKAGPVIKKDLYPTRYSQPTPLTGTVLYCMARYLKFVHLTHRYLNIMICSFDGFSRRLSPTFEHSIYYQLRIFLSWLQCST